MDTYTANAYGDGLASVYDLMYPTTPDAQAAGAFIAELAGDGGRVLELGVGTGRIASEVAALGVDVHGVDASQKMLDVLHEKHGGGRITTQLLDFTADSTGQLFDVVYIPLSTFFVAQTVTRQLSVMRLIREQLAPEGVAVIEAFEPHAYHDQEGPRTESLPLADGRVQLNTISVDRVRQLLLVHHATIGEGTYETAQEIVRYAFPTEIDLMARLNGLEISGRWGDWQRAPFTMDSVRHVSLYRPV